MKRLALLVPVALLASACSQLTGTKPDAACTTRNYDVHQTITLDTLARPDSIPVRVGSCR